MPRTSREKSNTGIYHVLLRGINKQRIFEDDEDYSSFIETLRKFKEISEYEIYGYCLMNNHIHILMKEGNEELGNTFRRIGASYVYWYNWKYNRTGHLFQDRFKSEEVETDKYFLTVLRYIHQNPLKACITQKLNTYNWSSYNEYIKRPVICNTAFALALFSPDSSKALEQFKKFNQQENEDKSLEYDDGIRLNDIEATKVIQQIGEVKNPKDLQSFEKEKRNEVIKKLKMNGLSIRQIQRLTGISFGIIRKL